MKPSPTARGSAKGKQKDSYPKKKDGSVPKVSPTAGRKRKGESSGSNGADKKSLQPRKPAQTPKSKMSLKDGRTSAKGDTKKQPAHEYGDEDGGDGEESEIDTNLDYCEVCLAAGDLVCCDVCPRSFHLACLKMKESDLPEGDWQCAECRKPSYFVKFRATVHMKQSVYGKCVETIRCLKSHPYSKQFLSPVTNVEHYRNIVKEPMDLSTIEAKLKADKYVKSVSASQGEKVLDIDAFAHDVRLVWSNCKLFNDDGSGITRAADELAAGFEDIYKDLQLYVKSQPVKASKATSSSSAVETSHPKTPPHSLQPKPVASSVSSAPPALAVESEPSAAAATTPPKLTPAGPNVPMAAPAKDPAKPSRAVPSPKPTETESRAVPSPTPSLLPSSAEPAPGLPPATEKPKSSTVSSASSVKKDAAPPVEANDKKRDDSSEP